MHKCETCRYWTRDEGVMGTCACAKFEEGGDIVPDGLTYTDYECYSASFRTGENFGCVHHAQNGKNEATL